jgi:hypothetical protein
MKPLTPEHLVRLDEALAGRRCVSAWLGYGEVLFLGFGEEVLPERDADGRHPSPPFQLATNFADWSVAGAVVAASAESERVDLEAAAASLVGQRVVAGEALEGNRLRIEFAQGQLFVVGPWGVEEGLSDAWSVQSPDGRLLAVATDGRAVVVEARRPINEWFR